MSLFQRYIRHRSPGSTQDDALVQRYLPLDAGRMAILANNAQHLCEQNPRRALRQHPGVRDFYAPAMSGTSFTDPPTSFTDPPTVNDVRWAVSQKDGACCIDLGTFFAWQFPNGRLPRLRCKFTGMVEGGYTLGWVLAVSPGLRGPLSAVAQSPGSTTSATWTEQDPAIDLSRGHTTPWAMAPTNGVDEAVTEEAGQVPLFRVFLGAYCSSNSNTGGARASIVGITLYCEQP